MTEVWPPHGEEPSWLAPYVDWPERYRLMQSGDREHGWAWESEVGEDPTCN